MIHVTREYLDMLIPLLLGATVEFKCPFHSTVYQGTVISASDDGWLTVNVIDFPRPAEIHITDVNNYQL